MQEPLDARTVREIADRLGQIQTGCRAYVDQPDVARKMTFAGIRIAADAIGSLCEESDDPLLADRIRGEVNRINAEIDELAGRFGSDEAGRCAVCGAELQGARLPGGSVLRYCVRCPTGILDAVRVISDLTGAEAL